MSNIIRHIYPTFIINKIKGWNTRLIYNYYGAQGSTLDFITDSGNTPTRNLFSIINDSSLISSTGGIYKGQYDNFHTRYFKTGKTLRVKGQFLITGNDTDVFNIYSKIDITGTGSPTTIASSNNGNNHVLAVPLTDCPINFELTYTSLEQDGDPTRTYILSNGFCQYNTNNYNGNGTNATNAYVPIYNSGGYQNVGVTSDSYDLWLSFDNSTVSSIKVVHITIEELQ